jgi:FtsZ-binding cell division protein ZapB
MKRTVYDVKREIVFLIEKRASVEQEITKLRTDRHSLTEQINKLRAEQQRRIAR